jgi:cold shock CspA family protein
MKECWINVYWFNGQHNYGYCWPNKGDDIFINLIYRIHVKLK